MFHVPVSRKLRTVSAKMCKMYLDCPTCTTDRLQHRWPFWHCICYLCDRDYSVSRFLCEVCNDLDTCYSAGKS